MMNEALKQLESYLNGDKLAVRYTLQTDDLSSGGAKNFAKPYNDRKAYFIQLPAAGELYCEETKTSLRAEFITVGGRRGVLVKMRTTRTDLSEFSLELPINFMGKKNGGGWQNQYLLNSPYTSAGNKYKYCYLSNPNGKNLILFPQGKCDGWKCNYSSDYCPGHFFVSLEFMPSFDKAYGTGSHNTSLTLYIFETTGVEDGISLLCAALHTCALTYEKSYVKIGETLRLRVHGECDSVLSCGKKYEVKQKNGEKYIEIEAKKYGLCRAYPYYGKKRGLEAAYYAFDNVKEVYRRALDAVSDEEIGRTDQNLCEWQCWQSAMLRYMLRYGKKEKYLKRLRKAFETVLEKDETKAVPRCTIFNKPHGGEDSYYIFESGRIQELLFGVTILTDAYRLTGNAEYFEYFTGALDNVLKHHFENGMIFTGFLNGEKEDYTTVCCLIIPFVDAAVLLEKTHPEFAARYKKASEQIAAYLYAREGFHTEAYVSPLTDPEMEDGSISCTALSLLYYCAKIRHVEKYIVRAKEILDMHEAWMTRAPIAPCFRSSLRWWETFWEGDGDGPSICFGHAWTIWRAEADYWYYKLTGNEKYKEKAFNGYMSNISKVAKSGKTYSCYCADYIKGGGFTKDCAEVKHEIRLGKPKLTDSGLTRYVWIRAFDELFDL